MEDYHLDSKDDNFVDCEGIFDECDINSEICVIQAKEKGIFGSFDVSELVYWQEDKEPAVVCSTLSFGPNKVSGSIQHYEDDFLDSKLQLQHAIMKTSLLTKKNNITKAIQHADSLRYKISKIITGNTNHLRIVLQAGILTRNWNKLIAQF